MQLAAPPPEPIEEGLLFHVITSILPPRVVVIQIGRFLHFKNHFTVFRLSRADIDYTHILVPVEWIRMVPQMERRYYESVGLEVIKFEEVGREAL
jgi:hypothetical protein